MKPKLFPPRAFINRESKDQPLERLEKNGVPHRQSHSSVASHLKSSSHFRKDEKGGTKNRGDHRDVIQMSPDRKNQNGSFNPTVSILPYPITEGNH